MQHKVFRSQHGTIRKNHGTLDRMLQFADIARPCIALQFRFRISGKPSYLFLILAGITVQKIIGQQQDIISPFAEWRDMQLDRIDPV